jgi:hypothetical protein
MLLNKELTPPYRPDLKSTALPKGSEVGLRHLISLPPVSEAVLHHYLRSTVDAFRSAAERAAAKLKAAPTTEIIFEGWLTKRSVRSGRNWKKRWFTLCQESSDSAVVLAYFKDFGQKAAGEVVLNNETCIEPGEFLEKHGHGFTLRKVAIRRHNSRAAEDTTEELHLAVPSAARKEEWIRALQSGILKTRIQPSEGKVQESLVESEAEDGAAGGSECAGDPTPQHEGWCEWPSDTDEEMIRIVAEALSQKQATTILTNLHFDEGDDIVHNAELVLEHILASIMSVESMVRHWAIKSLWCLLQAYSTVATSRGRRSSEEVKAIGAVEKAVAEEGGFLGLVSRHLFYQPQPSAQTQVPSKGRVSKDIVKPVPSAAPALPIDHAGCTALLEIAVGALWRPSDSNSKCGDGGRVLETFGKTLHMGAIEALELLFSWLNISGDSCLVDLRRQVLKDVFVLLMRSKKNCAVLSSVVHWQRCVLPTLEIVPRRVTERSDAEIELYKYTINICSCVHSMQFEVSRADFIAGLNETLLTIHEDYGWGDDSVSMARNLLINLVLKIEKSVRLWKAHVEACAWQSLWELLAVVEMFMFKQPVDRLYACEEQYLLTRRSDDGGDGGGGGGSGSSSSSSSSISSSSSSSSSIRGSEGSDANKLSKTGASEQLRAATRRPTGKLGKVKSTGVHINLLELKCDDTALVLAMLSLLKSLGFSPVAVPEAAEPTLLTRSVSAPHEVSRQEREQQRRGNEAATVFHGYRARFAGIEQALLAHAQGKEDASTYLKKRAGLEGEAVVHEISTFLTKRQ